MTGTNPEKLVPLFDMKEECKEPVVAEIKGNVPSWLTGDLFRIGPGNFKYGKAELIHLFDGDAVAHKFRIKDGQVSYCNRFLDSESRTQCMQAERIVLTQFGTASQPDPCLSIFQRFMSWFSMPTFEDNCNVSFLEIGDKLMALTETPMVYEVDRETLQNGKKIDITKYTSIHTSTAHPHVDSDGSIISYGTSIGLRPKYGFFRIPPQNEGEKIDNPYVQAKMICQPTSTHSYLSYAHSFGLTENYIVFMEQSLFVDHWKLVRSNIWPCSFEETLFFDEEKKTRFVILDKKTGNLVSKSFVTDPLFCFHHINAYEDDGHVVVDICQYPDSQIIKDLYLAPLREGLTQYESGTLPQPTRYVLPLHSHLKKDTVNLNKLSYSYAEAVLTDDGEIYCKAESLSDEIALLTPSANDLLMTMLVQDSLPVLYIRPAPGPLSACCDFELPRINYEKCNGRKYRYTYGVSKSLCETEEHKPAIVKLDLEEKTNKVWREDRCFPSEPVFVANPDGSDEDDGVVLSVILKMDEKPSSFLLILDGKTFQETARASVNYSIPISIHGLFSSN